MGRRSRRGIMSEEFKYELAKDLGFYETVQREGWAGIRTKDAGNMVKRAIQIAEQTLAQQQQQQRSPQNAASYGQPAYAQPLPSSMAARPQYAAAPAYIPVTAQPYMQPSGAGMQQPYGSQYQTPQ
ncbi:hypothetical protein PAECIP111802_06348 [Paenibacillus allorhizosphaerae]|uniref:Small, acid-soluble spore protein, alpha/beta type n=1 Tax=Paenibacillus allorhizosphaerae TaxID=2849866 RepID=A0ABM8VS94_9BACL|nr:hypothetical protein PAECIP111802_06348 [Paenibacillus allorhizosphaerae]